MSEEIKKIDVFTEILKWVKILGIDKLKKILKDNLDNDIKQQIYELSDGVATTRDIASKFSISTATVASYWDEWTNLGIMEKIPVSRGMRGKKLFNLSDFNLENDYDE